VNTTIQLVGRLTLVIITLFLIGCSQVEFSGKVEGDDSQASNKIGLIYKPAPYIGIASSIHQPYIFSDPRLETPDFTETSFLIEF
jgi:hypothetical protein